MTVTAANDIGSLYYVSSDAVKNILAGSSDTTQGDNENMFGSILNQIADIFKGGKSHCKCNGGYRQFLWLRLKDQKEEQQRYQLHHFLTDWSDLYSSHSHICSIISHEETADISREQAGAHAKDYEQHKATS